jgi:small conductance mechanosensitive channel
MDILSISLADVLADVLAFLPTLLVSLLIFILGIYLAGFISRMVRRTMVRRKSDPEITLLVAQITRWMILILGVFFALQQVGFDLTAFLAGLGILGFTVGFALQDVSKNFVSGMLLLLEQPFDLGDVIEVGDFIGTVAKVDIRATEIYTFDGQNVIIPNGDIFTSPIKNYSRYEKRRLDFTIGVAYGSDLELVRKTTLEVVAVIPGVLTDPQTTLVFNNLGDSSIDFTVYFWIDLNATGYLTAVDAAITGINAAFEQNNIEIPFPVRTVQMVQ